MSKTPNIDQLYPEWEKKERIFKWCKDCWDDPIEWYPQPLEQWREEQIRARERSNACWTYGTMLGVGVLATTWALHHRDRLDNHYYWPLKPEVVQEAAAEKQRLDAIRDQEVADWRRRQDEDPRRKEIRRAIEEQAEKVQAKP